MVTHRETRIVQYDGQGRPLASVASEWQEPADVHRAHAAEIEAESKHQAHALREQLAEMTAHRDRLAELYDRAHSRAAELEQEIIVQSNAIEAERRATRDALAASLTAQIARDEQTAADLNDPTSELGSAFAAVAAAAREAEIAQLGDARRFALPTPEAGQTAIAYLSRLRTDEDALRALDLAADPVRPLPDRLSWILPRGDE